MKKQLSIRIDEEILKEAKEESIKRDCSQNSVLIQWIKKGIKYEKMQNVQKKT